MKGVVDSGGPMEALVMTERKKLLDRIEDAIRQLPRLVTWQLNDEACALRWVKRLGAKGKILGKQVANGSTSPSVSTQLL